MPGGRGAASGGPHSVGDRHASPWPKNRDLKWMPAAAGGAGGRWREAQPWLGGATAHGHLGGVHGADREVCLGADAVA